MIVGGPIALYCKNCLLIKYYFIVYKLYGIFLEFLLAKQLTSMYNNLGNHSSEKRGMRSTFLSSEMLQNLPYLWKKKTHVVFLVFHLEQL